MFTITVYMFEVQIEAHNLPQREMFRFGNTGGGEVFIDFHKGSLTLPNLQEDFTKC